MALGQIAPKTAGSTQPRKFPWLTLRTAVKSVATLHKKFTKNILGKSFLFVFILVHHFVSHINGYSWFSIYDSSQNRKKRSICLESEIRNFVIRNSVLRNCSTSNSPILKDFRAYTIRRRCIRFFRNVLRLYTFFFVVFYSFSICFFA